MKFLFKVINSKANKLNKFIESLIFISIPIAEIAKEYLGNE